MRTYHKPWSKANAWYDNTEKALRETLADFAGPVHHVSYDALLANPTSHVRALAEFAFQDIAAPSDLPIYEAAQFIDPINTW